MDDVELIAADATMVIPEYYVTRDNATAITDVMYINVTNTGSVLFVAEDEDG